MDDAQPFLQGKTAVVTGASAGIGQMTALALAAHGADVVLAARREERLRSIAEEIHESERPGRALTAVTDVRSEADIVRLTATANREFGGVDILINNAGHGYLSTVAEIDAERLDEVMQVNFRGAVLCAKYMVPGMVKRRSGTVVNVVSASARRGWASGTPYVASKFALRGFAHCLWAEVREHNVRVINLYPDFVASEFFDVMKVKLPGVENAMAPESIAEIIVGALRLPQNTNVLELDVCPTSMR